jgi:hypothetical protein
MSQSRECQYYTWSSTGTVVLMLLFRNQKLFACFCFNFIFPITRIVIPEVASFACQRKSNRVYPLVPSSISVHHMAFMVSNCFSGRMHQYLVQCIMLNIKFHTTILKTLVCLFILFFLHWRICKVHPPTNHHQHGSK